MKNDERDPTLIYSNQYEIANYFWITIRFSHIKVSNERGCTWLSAAVTKVLTFRGSARTWLICSLRRCNYCTKLLIRRSNRWSVHLSLLSGELITIYPKWATNLINHNSSLFSTTFRNKLASLNCSKPSAKLNILFSLYSEYSYYSSNEKQRVRDSTEVSKRS